MPKFNYIGQSLDGKEARGAIDARNAEDAREQLRKRSILAEHITPEIAFAPQESPPAASSYQQTIATVAPTEAEQYFPLSDTFRLYAGWLLAWYCLVYLLGAYQSLKQLPFTIPFIDGLFQSPLVLNFAFGTFLFLLFSTIHRWMGRGLWKGIGLTIVWLALVTWFVVNVG